MEAKNFRNICICALKTRNTIKMLAVVAILETRSDEWFIDEIGSYFYDYRKQIQANNIDFFLKYDFHEQRKKWGFLGILSDSLVEELREMVIALPKETTKKMADALLTLYMSKHKLH